MSFASFAGLAGQSGYANQSGSRTPARPRRALEIVGIVAAFFYYWPMAIAYLGWKMMGYPVPPGWRDEVRRTFSGVFGGGDMFRNARWNASAFAATSGNRAFDDYRRAEIDRLDAERRRLDEEARDFRSFVEDLKRAKDREEFDAYMAKRRASGSGQV